MLCAHRQYAQHQVLGVAHLRQAGYFFAELARLIFVGQQRGKGGVKVVARERGFQLNPFGHKGFGAGRPQGTGSVQQNLPALRVGAQVVFGFGQAGKVGVLLAERQHRFFHHALCVGQGKFGAFVKSGLQGLVGLAAPVIQDHGLVVGLETVLPGLCRVIRIISSQQRGIKPPPHQGLGGGIVLQQLVVGRQLHLLQKVQRGAAQKGCKPAVKGTNLHLPAVA